MSRFRFREFVDISTNLICCFARANGGNTAMIFALTATTVLVSGGAGLDLSRTIYDKNRAAAALDSAALAVGVADTSEDLSNSELTDIAQNVFDANFASSGLGSADPVVVTQNAGSISLSVIGTVPTTLLQLIGINTFPYTFVNEVSAGSTALEVALVLDNTGSMSGSKLASLKSAAKELVDTLSGGDTSPERLWFSVIPFAQTVRLDTDVALAGNWMDEECRSSVSQLNFDNGMCAYTVLETMHSNTTWAGCVEARPGDLATNDTAPVYGTPDTLFVPYFQPDEPDDGDVGAGGEGVDDDYSDDYLEDGSIHDYIEASGYGRGGYGGGYYMPPVIGSGIIPVSGYGGGGFYMPAIGGGEGGFYIPVGGKGGYGGSGSGGSGQPGSDELTRLRDSSKYENQNKYNQVNENCAHMEPILPLSNDMKEVKLSIDRMTADGYTHIPFGAVWGWRTLSPTEPFSEGVEYDDDSTRKVLIIMTDGENTMPSQSTMNKSRYTAFGYVRQGRLGTTTSTSAAADKLDDMLLEVCDNAKDNDILVYTIGFAINSSNVQSLLNECASEEDMYFNSPSASALQSAFGQIATDLSNLRLTK
jgi:Flp pilus assembly protein TadG